jgi:hypothetical protein
LGVDDAIWLTAICHPIHSSIIIVIKPLSHKWQGWTLKRKFEKIKEGSLNIKIFEGF